MTNPDNKCALKQNFRAEVYRGLADAFHLPGPEPTTAFLKLEEALSMLDSEGRRDAGLMHDSYEATEDVMELQIDYARLFAGPFLVLAPPYGSVYLEGERRTMGDSTVEAEQCFRQAGLRLAEDFKEAPDHITVELEFMHVLVCREIEALYLQAPADAQAAAALQRSFLKRHLGAWVPAFTEKVSEEASTAFYRYLAATTRAFVAEEVDAFNPVCGPAKTSVSTG